VERALSASSSVEILDGKDHRGGRYERFFGSLIVDFLNGKGMHRIAMAALRWAATPEEMATAEVTFQTELRALVDGFIQTGVDENGVETPSNRRVRAAVDEPPIPIFDVLYEWFVRNKPMPALTNDGTIAILAGQPRFDGRSLEQYGRDMAIYYFQELLASPLWTRIGKCTNRHCGQYFVRQRRRKTPIKRGSFCGECTLIGAAERTRRSRRERKRQMLDIAAQAWNAADEHRLRKDRAAWIAAQVNKKFGKMQFICSKWVNQNRKEIEAIAAGRRHP
jgi:hypothetical protein